MKLIRSNITAFVTPQIFHRDPWAVHVLENKLNKMVTYEECNESTEFGDDEIKSENDQSKFEVSFDFW
jgi:hypothetical protein